MPVLLHELACVQIALLFGNGTDCCCGVYPECHWQPSGTGFDCRGSGCQFRNEIVSTTVIPPDQIVLSLLSVLDPELQMLPLGFVEPSVYTVIRSFLSFS